MAKAMQIDVARGAPLAVAKITHTLWHQTTVDGVTFSACTMLARGRQYNHVFRQAQHGPAVRQKGDHETPRLAIMAAQQKYNRHNKVAVGQARGYQRAMQATIAGCVGVE